MSKICTLCTYVLFLMFPSAASLKLNNPGVSLYREAAPGATPNVTGANTRCQWIPTKPEKNTAAEEVTEFENGNFFAGGGNLMEILGAGHGVTNQGGIFLIDARNLKAEELPITGWPNGLLLQPHGMYFSKLSRILYVVNHAGKDGSRIEMINVQYCPGGPGNALAAAMGGVCLTYLRPVTSKLFDYVGINDVVEGVGDIYITKWRRAGIHPQGDAGTKGLSEAEAAKYDLFTQGKDRPCGILRCLLMGTFPDGDACKLIVSDYAAANGITMDTPRQNLYVTDWLGHTLSKYRREFDGSLTFEKSLHVENEGTVVGADNIQFDDVNQVVWGAFMTNPMNLLSGFAEKMANPDAPQTIFQPGGIFQVKPQDFTSTVVLRTNGTELHTSSAGVSADWGFMGGIAYGGVYACPMK